jgi:predicted DNA binding CopG/RHH family protein
VSAFAADRQISSMNDRAAKASLPSITVRPCAADKARFALLAERAGMSESSLALLAIRKLLEQEATTTAPAVASARVAATDRITIRLRPGDGAALARRASERGMRPSTYVAALVRAHVAVNPPLASAELAALKQSVVVLAGVGTLLAQTARNPALGGPAVDDVRQSVSRTRAAVAALEQRTQEFTRKALISWETQRG